MPDARLQKVRDAYLEDGWFPRQSVALASAFTEPPPLCRRGVGDPAHNEYYPCVREVGHDGPCYAGI